MPRPKNNELHQQITLAARNLFYQNGYTATSYADIADACGLAKTNIQQHFPTKDRFITDFYRDLLDELDACLEKQGTRTDNYYVNLYLIGQYLFSFLLGSEPMKKFTMDIISHRELTEIMIDLEVEWATSYEVGFSKEELAAFRDDIAMIMGGIYELLYRKLKAGEELAPEDIQFRIMGQFAYLRGKSLEEIRGLFPSDLISDEQFSATNEYLSRALFS